MKEMACPNCNKWKLCWDTDADSEDCGYMDAGIVSYYHCTNCGAQLEIHIPYRKNIDKENEE